jgi:hypothetical protein
MSRLSRVAAAIALVAVSAAAPLAAVGRTLQSPALRIVVIEGEGAVNVIQQKTAVAPVVEVRDRNDQPVAGAIVRFAIQSGRGAFGTARTLSVTTNAAGQAMAAGLTPTSSGVLQISATAAFQGQTAAAVTIAQTNVMTAAQAAALSSSSGAAGAGGSSAGGASAGAGAGAGGGASAGAGASAGVGAGAGASAAASAAAVARTAGGLSLTAIGVVGGAAAGGTLAAVNGLGGSEESSGATTARTTYVGAFSMQSVYNSTATTNGVVTGHCTGQSVAMTGTVTVKLDATGAGEVSAEWIESVGAAGQCPARAVTLKAQGSVGSASNITLASDNGSANYESPSGTVHLARSWAFSGTFDGSVVSGTVTMSQVDTLVAPAGPGLALTGGHGPTSTVMTLSKQ